MEIHIAVIAIARANYLMIALKDDDYVLLDFKKGEENIVSQLFFKNNLQTYQLLYYRRMYQKSNVKPGLVGLV